MTNEAALAAVDAALDVEDLSTARSLLTQVGSVTPEDAWRLEVMRLILCMPEDSDPTWARPLDELAVQLGLLARDSRASGALRERAFLTSLMPAQARRLHQQVLVELDAWEAVRGPSARTIVSRADVYVAMDDLARAKELLDATDPELGGAFLTARLARLHYRVADFAAAEAHCLALRGTRFALEAADGRASIAASTGDLAAELEAVSEAIELAPASVEVAGRLWRRALVLASLDRVVEAKRDFEAALAAVPVRAQRMVARHVRHRLDALETVDAGARHARLNAFPTIVQKWNYCGPAVIELCLRYAGIEMTQDLIAEAVKRDEGTPMFAIVDFLREQGFEVRRVEATAIGVRAAIDAGVPVILESAYSNSGHVSVAIGYDDRLGVLIVADPMTHAPSLEGVELRGDVARSLRFSGVAVLGRATEVTDEMRTRLDEAGLVDSAVISRFDDIGRRMGDATDVLTSLTASEAAGIAMEVLEAEPDYAQAARTYADALYNSVQDSASSEEAHRALVAMRSRFPEDAGLAGVAASWYRYADEPAVAVAEAIAAVSLDPNAADPRYLASYYLAEIGERELAYEHASAGFLRAPHEPRHTAMLASVAVQERVDRAKRRGELGVFAAALFDDSTAPADPPQWPMKDDQLAVLADALVNAASSMGEVTANIAVARGDLAVLRGDMSAAVSSYRDAVTASDSWNLPHVRLAFAAADVDESTARAQIELIAARASIPADAWAALVSLAARLGDLGFAQRVAEASLDAVDDAQLPMRALFDAIVSSTRSEPAAARTLVSLASARPQNEQALWSVVNALERTSVRGHAVTVLRDHVRQVPEDALAHYRLALLIARTPACLAEALEHMERARELAPWADVLPLEQAWMLLATEPWRVRAIVDNIHEQSVSVLELRRQVAYLAGTVSEQARADDALERLCGSPYEARVAAAVEHVRAGRLDYAAQIDIPGEPRSGQLADVIPWATALARTGRGDHVVAFVAGHPELAAVHEIAELIAFEGNSLHPQLVGDAARLESRLTTDPSMARVFEVEALCVEGRFDAAVVAAGDDPHALARCTEWAPTVAEEIEIAGRAYAAAPEDRTVAAAWHSALLNAGRLDAASAVAHAIAENFPFEHQGPERIAESEALHGDVAVAIAQATTAVAEHPVCPRALAAAAIAHAVGGDWGQASTYVARHNAVSRPNVGRVDLSPARLVAAAVASDRGAFDGAMRDFERSAPGYPISRLAAACEAHMSEGGKARR